MAELQREDLTLEQQVLWHHVEELWEMARERRAEAIRSAIHPRYAGWDMSHPEPHDREAAVQSVLGDAPELTDYRLTPLSVEIYEHLVGVVHYRYSATVEQDESTQSQVTGKWTEIYLKEAGQWILIGVSGRPDTALTRE
jgi:hypothetical protein